MIFRTAKRLWSYLKFYKLDIAIVVVSLGVVSGCLLTLGRILRTLIDSGLSNESISSTNSNIIVMAALVLLFSVASFVRSYFIGNLSEKIIGKIRVEAFAKCLELQIEQIEEIKTGDLIARFSTDLELIAKLITDFLSFFLRNFIMAFGSVILMFTESLKLSLIILSIVPLCLVPLLLLSKFVRKLSKDSLGIKDIIYCDLIESFTNIRTIYAFNQEQNKINQFQVATTLYLQSSKARQLLRSLFFAGAISGILLSIIFVIWIGIVDIIDGRITSGAMISFIYYAIIAGMSAAGLAEVIAGSSGAVSAAQRVFDLIGARHCEEAPWSRCGNPTLDTKELDCHAPKRSLAMTGDAVHTIEFQDIRFYYPKNPDLYVLDNISFKINKGDFIGIMGKSGVGKSTILQLLLKFYAPASGHIKINDSDLDQIDTKDFRSKIAYVSQEPAIFSGSIKSNIAFAREFADIGDIVHIAEITGIMEFAQNLDDGLDSKIGERGLSLSGGQKQRIAIARALLTKPDILLLDEATSALDLKSESQVLEGIKQVMQNGIIISIAHRESALKGATRIMTLEK
jgi:ATP-binding cassette, subfamily B, bacterial